MAETPAPSTGFDLGKMFADPNFQLLLANMGKQMDPEGAGGVIGSAAANMISSKAAQTALEKRDAARNAQVQKLIDLHGGITPPDRPGINSVKATPSGSYTLDLNLPPLDLRTEAQRPVGEGSVLAPGAAPVRTQPLTAAAAPTVAAPTTTAPAAAPVRTAARRQPDITDIAPFYLAPEDLSQEVLRG